MRVVLAALIFSSLIACSKKEGDKPAETKPTETKTTETKPTEAPAAAPVAPAAPAAAAVDTCAFATKEQIETALGGKSMVDPKADPATGSFLGGCTYMTDAGTASVSARPADEFDATARKGTEVAGIGEKAMQTDSGLLVKVAGKPYFLHVMVLGKTGSQDAAKASEVAKVVVAGAK